MRTLRHNLISYSLEAVPRPGAREIRVRPVPDGLKVQPRRENIHGQ